MTHEEEVDLYNLNNVHEPAELAKNTELPAA